MGKVSAEKITKELLEEVLRQIGVQADFTVEDTEESVIVKVSGDNLGALIGYHGETLESLQLLLALMLNRKLGSEVWHRVLVDIGNWRAERSEALREIVQRGIDQLEQTGQERTLLPAMGADQRRQVHVIVSEQFPSYVSFSEGEEPNRRIYVSKNH